MTYTDEEKQFWIAYERIKYKPAINETVIKRQFQAYIPPRIERPLIMEVA